MFLREIEDCINADEDFAFETTLAGRGYLKLVNKLQVNGWRVEMVYLALPSAEMSRLRVAERVTHGGHNISESDIIRRFPRSLHNLLYVLALKVDQTRCFMNVVATPQLIFQQIGINRNIFDPDLFVLLEKAAQL